MIMCQNHMNLLNSADTQLIVEPHAFKTLGGSNFYLEFFYAVSISGKCASRLMAFSFIHQLNTHARTHTHTCVCVCVLSHLVLSDSLQPCGLQPAHGSSVHGISQAGTLAWVAFPSPGDLLNPGVESPSLALAGGFLTTSHLGNPVCVCVCVCVLLSHFSRVQLCVTPQTAALRLLCPWDSPGKNTGVGCPAPSRGSDPYVLVFYVSCIGRWVLYLQSYLRNLYIYMYMCVCVYVYMLYKYIYVYI